METNSYEGLKVLINALGTLLVSSQASSFG
jgi:hypothetical protein